MSALEQEPKATDLNENIVNKGMHVIIFQWRSRWTIIKRLLACSTKRCWQEGVYCTYDEIAKNKLNCKLIYFKGKNKVLEKNGGNWSLHQP